MPSKYTAQNIPKPKNAKVWQSTSVPYRTQCTWNAGYSQVIGSCTDMTSTMPAGGDQAC